MLEVPAWASFDPRALALFVAAAVAIFRFKLSAAVTLGLSSAAGLMLVLFGFGAYEAAFEQRSVPIGMR